MTAREAKKACATKGLVVDALIVDYACFGHTIQAYPRRQRPVVTIHAESWPLAVAAFKGWLAEWEQQNRLDELVPDYAAFTGRNAVKRGGQWRLVNKGGAK